MVATDPDEAELGEAEERAGLYRLHLALLGGALVAFLVGAAWPHLLRTTLVLCGAMVVASAFAGLWAERMLGTGTGFLLHQLYADAGEERKAEVARRFLRFRFVLYLVVGVSLVALSALSD